MASRVTWRGDEVKREAERQLGGALVEFGLRCETGAKKRLRPSEQDERGRYVKGGGHGKRGGTLQRSIHIATPGYNWAGDNVPDGSAGPERGGQVAEPAKRSGRITLELGSGLEYALTQHQNHKDPLVYHFIVNAVDEQRPKLPSILKAHQVGR